MFSWMGTKPKYPAGHCQFCGYNLYSLQGDLCPECGKSRFAWVEAKCEACRRVSVFTVEDAGRLNDCPFCGKTVDVQRDQRDGLGH